MTPMQWVGVAYLLIAVLGVLWLIRLAR